MTTIAYKDGIMAADTAATSGNAKLLGVTKIAKHKDGLLCGGAGTLVTIAQIMRTLHTFKGYDDIVAAVNDMMDEDSQFLLADQRGRVFIIEAGGIAQVRTKFISIGTGSAYAMAAMHMGADAKEAVQVARKFDIFTGGRIMSLSLDARHV